MIPGLQIRKLTARVGHCLVQNCVAKWQSGSFALSGRAKLNPSFPSLCILLPLKAVSSYRRVSPGCTLPRS